MAVEGDGCFVAPGAGDVADGVASAAEDEDWDAVFEHVFDAFAVALGGKKKEEENVDDCHKKFEKKSAFCLDN